jgi:hypothetical protein
MRKNLLAWQWAHYAEAHQDRKNLLLHALSAPLFMAGSLLTLVAPWTHGSLALGAFGMVAALALQGRGHRGEAHAPAPFLGPLDFVRRLLAEQWVTFPRFVLSGGFVRAWAAASESSPSHGVSADAGAVNR